MKNNGYQIVQHKDKLVLTYNGLILNLYTDEDVEGVIHLGLESECGGKQIKASPREDNPTHITFRSQDLVSTPLRNFSIVK